MRQSRTLKTDAARWTSQVRRASRKPVSIYTLIGTVFALVFLGVTGTYAITSLQILASSFGPKGSSVGVFLVAALFFCFALAWILWVCVRFGYSLVRKEEPVPPPIPIEVGRTRRPGESRRRRGSHMM